MLRWRIESRESRGEDQQIIFSVDFENHLEEIGLRVDGKLTQLMIKGSVIPSQAGT